MAFSFSVKASDCYEPALGPLKPRSSLEALPDVRVPVLLGVTKQDGLGASELEQLFFCKKPSTKEELKSFLQRFQLDVFDHYWSEGLSEPLAAHQALSGLSNDLWYFAGTYRMAQLLSNTKSFLYCFAGAKNSTHGSDTAFWRGQKRSQLSQQMASYLVNFACSGDPNSPGLPVWRAFAEGEWMCLEQPPSMRQLPETDRKWFDFLSKSFEALSKSAPGTRPAWQG